MTRLAVSCAWIVQRLALSCVWMIVKGSALSCVSIVQCLAVSCVWIVCLAVSVDCIALCSFPACLKNSFGYTWSWLNFHPEIINIILF